MGVQDPQADEQFCNALRMKGRLLKFLCKSVIPGASISRGGGGQEFQGVMESVGSVGLNFAFASGGLRLS